VTFAVEAEFAPWRKLRNLQSIEVEGQRMNRAQIGRAAVDFVVTGMGIDNARRVADLVLNDGYQFCVCSGFAGALRDELKLGEILVGRAVRQIGKSTTLESSRNLFHNAAQGGATRANLFLTSDKVIRTAKEKADLGPFGEAVDMETFGVFEVAHQKRIPVIAIRAISDTSRSELPEGLDGMLDDHGKLNIVGTIRFIAQSPRKLPMLIRLGRDSWTVAGGLASFLESFIKQLSFYTDGWFPEGEGLEKVAAR